MIKMSNFISDEELCKYTVIDLEKLKTKTVVCNNCKYVFKYVGKKVICPNCKNIIDVM